MSRKIPSQIIDKRITTLNKIKGAIKNIYSKKSAQKIREFLKEQNIRGDVGGFESCPIANYLKKETGQPCNVVGKRIIFDDISLNLESTNAIKTFVRNFDSNKYPELEI